MKKLKIITLFTAVIFLFVIGLSRFQGEIIEYIGGPSVSLVGEASAAESKQKITSIADARRTLQESSRRIAELVRQRPTTNPFRNISKPDKRTEQERIDVAIDVIQRERAEALAKVVLAENPMVQIVDQSRGIYRVPINDGQGRPHWFSGSIVPIWHLQKLNPAVFNLAEAIRSRPAAAALSPDIAVTAHLWLAGTSSQSMVHPYPGDIDYSEELVVQAPTEAAAGEALTATFVELVTRANTNPILEFDLLNVMPTPQRRVKGADYRWTRARILDPSQRAELARQLAGVDGGRLNSDWRILVRGGRYIVIGKIYGIHALSSITGEELFATQWLGMQYQGIYFGEEVPPTLENVPLGEYASLMRFFALRYARGKYLKAAKRSFNYLRAIGDLEAMAEVARIFAGPAAKTSYQIVVLEAISMALDPAMSSRILLADDARNLLREAAAVMKVELPVMPGTNPGRPQWVADELHNIAAAIQSRTTEPVGIVEPNALLSEQMDTMLDFEIKPMIKLSLSDHIRSIINTYVR